MATYLKVCDVAALCSHRGAEEQETYIRPTKSIADGAGAHDVSFERVEVRAGAAVYDLDLVSMQI